MTLEELYCAINSRLCEIPFNKQFSEVVIEDEDSNEIIKRPSIRVIISDFKAQKYNFCGTTYTANPEIYYFSKSEEFSNEENIEMQQILEHLFLGGVQVGNATIEPKELQFAKETGLLYCKLVNMEHTVFNVEESGEIIETLELTMEGE